MLQSFSHTFTFTTSENSYPGEELENILSINEANAIKHFIHFTQYRIDHSDSTPRLIYRQCNIKVDRYYYLEIANIAISDRERRRRLFTVLGKRRFGANDNSIDPYLLNPLQDVPTLLESLKIAKGVQNPLPIRHERIDHARNRYEAIVLQAAGSIYVLMHQINISPRKSFEKTFLVELSKDDYLHLLNRETDEMKIEYIFNKMGKIYFKSIHESSIDLPRYPDDVASTLGELQVCGVDEITADQKERIVSVYDRLRTETDKLDGLYFALYSRGSDFLDRPESPHYAALFTHALRSFITELSRYDELDELTDRLSAILMLTENGKIPYLLKKHDSDLKDIAHYMFEALGEWHHALRGDGMQKRFTVATVDLSDALKHFFDSCIAFSHHYKCLDAKPEPSQPAQKKPQEQTAETPTGSTLPVISAKAFFEEIELESELLDELAELEEEVSAVHYAQVLDAPLRNGLIRFFDGYARMLNSMFEFKDLGYSLMLLSQKLSDPELEGSDGALMVIMQAMINDLVEWKVNVLMTQSALDIHYVDRSFYANVAQFDMLLKGEDGGSDNEVEFF